MEKQQKCGPSFLWQPERTWKVKQTNVQISADDAELKKEVTVNFAKSGQLIKATWR